jgi:hypothetical protein
MRRTRRGLSLGGRLLAIIAEAFFLYDVGGIE